jgi:membrane fusion protein (multidrug efflux system)
MAGRILGWVVVILGAGAIAGGLGYYKYAEIEAAAAATAAAPEPAEAVEAARVHSGEWTATARAVGTVVALRQVEIRNELAGTVAEVAFASGDIVEAGQVLVRFDTRQEEASLAAAEAEARMARLTFERRERLRGSQALSVHDLDQAREQHAAARARVEGLRIGIEKKTLVAPFRARVGLTDLQPGAYLDAGTRIVMLQGVDANAYVDFSLPQDATSAITPGSSVSLTAPQIPDGKATASIVADDASVDGSSRTVRFRAMVNGLGEVLRPGTFVDVVAVTSAPQPALFAPLTAVRRAPFGQYVFVLAEEDGKMRARQRIVRTGPVKGGDIAIVEGVAEGDLIAAAGSFKLREGILVNIDAPPAQSAQATAQ